VTFFYRVLVLALVAAVLVTGYQVAEAVLRRVNEQVEASARAPLYAQTGTAIAPTLVTYTPMPTETPVSSATPQPTSTPTLTLTPTPSPIPSATSTLTPSLTPSVTLTPSATAMVGLTATEAAQVLALAQAFVTNTPRPQNAEEVTLPPLNTAAAPTIEPTSAPTNTATMTAPPPPSPTLPAETSTPRPLPTVFVFGEAPADLAAPTGVPTPVDFVDRRGQDLMNIVLLGNDGELTEDGFIRTDTMIIVSINRTAGTVSMLGLPRDLLVYIPGWTMQRLNLAYIRGQSVGWTDGGFGLLRQTILYNFGINVHYYAMVNLTGLRAIVDAVGGVEVSVDCAIQNLPLIGADVPAAAQVVNEDGERLLPVGVYQMSGGEALWYARARDYTIEFDRQRRQMQLLRAIWRKARDAGLLTNAPTLWNEMQPYLETNLTFEDLVGLLPLALTLDPSGIENFNLRRLYHTTPWQTPDGDRVQLPVYDTMRPLLEDFYTPPTDSQLRAEGARIRVLNGTGNLDWDRVAADRLAYSGFLALPGGAASETGVTDTILIDYTGQTKGSSLQEIARLLNVRPENIRVQPEPDREYDFEVILGGSYNSCTEEGIVTVPGE
jgi:LCP family protein required for cell wall assembly